MAKTPSETQQLEFKEAKTQFDTRKLYEYCVALANEGGGYLLLGIANQPPRPFEDMDREDRIRACYQHCALKWVMAERMTNQSLRERFNLPENKSAVASQVIAVTIEAGLIKADQKVGASRKYARCLPFWA